MLNSTTQSVASAVVPPSHDTAPVAHARSCDALFAAGLLLLGGLVFALPVFPSGDGPVHIYYSKILYLLASHQGGPYRSVYFIRHLVQPYSLHYFWLIGLERITSNAIAEKSFVAAILLVSAFGFRFLARELGGRRAPAVSLWILPLLLSWALGSGFLNFCFAAGMLFFAYGLYLRYNAQPRPGTLVAYIFALFLLVLSHPVPLMLLVLLLACDITQLLFNSSVTRSPIAIRPLLRCACSAVIAFVFPVLIADKSSVAHSLTSDLRPHWAQVQAITEGYRLSLFAGVAPPAVLLTVVLVALVPAAMVLLLVSRQRDALQLTWQPSSMARRLCLSACLLLLATIVFPASMNGSALFADRMIPLLWPLVIVCAAAVPASDRHTVYSAATATGATLLSFALALAYLLPAARQQSALTEAALPQSARGLFITAPLVKRPFRAKLADDLLTWGGARAFAAHRDVLLNSPWMQLTIVPVGERGGPNGAAGLLRDQLPGSLSESPVALSKLLKARGPGATIALANADFLLYSDPASGAAQVARDARQYLPADASAWSCTVQGFYAVCLRKSVR